MSGSNTFDSERYKQATHQEWENTAEGWHKWIPFISELARDETNLMLDFARLQPGYRVLDIAAGDGDQSIMAAQRVGDQGYVLATDISANLLAYAANAAEKAGLDNFETRVMDGEDLELEDASFDAAICRQGLMLMPNAPTAVSEAYRVLKPGGWFSTIVFSTPDKNPWISIPAMTAMKHAQMPPPQPGMPGLFSLSPPGVLEGLFNNAGFQNVRSVYSNVLLKLGSAAECVVFVKDIAGALHTILSRVGAETQQAAWAEMEQALKQFETPGGFVSPVETLVVAGQKE